MSEETIFREVDEELRGDRARAFWRRFGPYIIGAAVLVVLAVAVNEGWRWWQGSNSARSSDQFYSALETAEKGDIAGAQASLDQIVASGSGGYPTLARFREAALLGQGGKAAEAIAAYDALANTESDPRLRQLALVFAGYLLVDGGDVAAVQQRVGGLIAPDNPMRNAAREAIGLTQYKAGDLNAALQTFGEVAADPLASRDLQNRMQIYTAQLVAEGAQTPEQQAAAAAAPAAPAAPEAAAAPAAPETPAAPVAPEAPFVAVPFETPPVPVETPAPAMQMQVPQGATPALTMRPPQAEQAVPAELPTPAPAAPPPVASAPPAAMQAPAPDAANPAVPMPAPDAAPAAGAFRPAVPMQAPAAASPAAN